MQQPSFVDADRARPVRECKAPATCGELIQGALDGRDFLVNSHSGTVLGILHVESEQFLGAMRGDIERHFGSDVEVVGDFAIVGGGCDAC